MKTSKEKQILDIIKFTPPIFIIIASIIVTLFLYNDYKSSILEEQKRIEDEFIKRNKLIIKERVDRIHNIITYFQKKTEKDLKENLKNRTYEAHKIATDIYEKLKDKKSKEEIIKLIKLALGGIRFNDGRGYFFIDNKNGSVILHPNKKLENRNFADLKDKNGYAFVQTIINTIKEKTEKFDEYYWTKPEDEKNVYKKISFYKYFAPYDFAICTGEYLADFEEKVKKDLLGYLNQIRYSQNGYIFIIDYNTINLSHIRKEYIGKSAISNNDTNEINKVIKDLIKISKNGSGYYDYVQRKKPDTQEATKKTSYVKGVNNWQWMIGTGFYEDDLIKQIENRKKILDDKFNSYIEREC